MKGSNIQMLLLRLVTGALFLYFGWGKYQDGWFQNTAPLAGSLAGYQQHAAGWHARYLSYVAVPYAGLWSKLIVAGELGIGCSLLLGLLVRLSTFLGMVMLLNIYAANGNLFSWAFFGSPSSALLFCALVILLLARAGRWGGAYALLAKSNARGLLW